MTGRGREQPQSREQDARKSGKVAPILSDYFISGEGINRSVLQSEICKYLGAEAVSRPAELKGEKGYIIRAIRPFTQPMLESLREASAAYGTERHRRREDNEEVPSYEQSDAFRTRASAGNRYGYEYESAGGPRYNDAAPYSPESMASGPSSSRTGSHYDPRDPRSVDERMRDSREPVDRSNMDPRDRERYNPHPGMSSGAPGQYGGAAPREQPSHYDGPRYPQDGGYPQMAQGYPQAGYGQPGYTVPTNDPRVAGYSQAHAYANNANPNMGPIGPGPSGYPGQGQNPNYVYSPTERGRGEGGQFRPPNPGTGYEDARQRGQQMHDAYPPRQQPNPYNSGERR